jgi:predicted transcriptional regulator|nr:hypothetical protein [uncultured Undibacterium sp.]
MMNNIPPEISTMSSMPTAHKLKWLRRKLKENQTEFWSRFGVTQSQGSRFEQGMCMQSPLAILLTLYIESKVNDDDLMVARQDSRLQNERMAA